MFSCGGRGSLTQRKNAWWELSSNSLNDRATVAFLHTIQDRRVDLSSHGAVLFLRHVLCHCLHNTAADVSPWPWAVEIVYRHFLVHLFLQFKGFFYHEIPVFGLCAPSDVRYTWVFIKATRLSITTKPRTMVLMGGRESRRTMCALNKSPNVCVRSAPV